MEEYRLTADQLIRFLRRRNTADWQIYGDGRWLSLKRVRKVRGQEVTLITFLRDGKEESEVIPWYGRWLELRG